jgi:hypothetical protein
MLVRLSSQVANLTRENIGKIYTGTSTQGQHDDPNAQEDHNPDPSDSQKPPGRQTSLLASAALLVATWIRAYGGSAMGGGAAGLGHAYRLDDAVHIPAGERPCFPSQRPMTCWALSRGSAMGSACERHT